MFICQFGMHNNVHGYRNANVCKQTYDASCRRRQMMLDADWDETKLLISEFQDFQAVKISEHGSGQRPRGREAVKRP